MLKLPFLNPVVRIKYYFIIILVGISTTSFATYQAFQFHEKEKLITVNLSSSDTQLKASKQELEKLQKEDQYVKNKELEKTITDIEKTYTDAVTVYEQLIELKTKTTKTGPLDEAFAQSLGYLSKRNYASASSSLVSLKNEIKKLETSLVAAVTIPPSVVSENTPPTSGYRRQSVQTDIGTYLVDIVSADLSSTRVIVDTASGGDCGNDCPVSSLADYAGRSGAYAGINGPYFCPAEYPSCGEKKNSFDTLLMNKNKVYFNSANNVYSTVPAVIFSGGSARWVGQSLEWGRDTGVDSVIANQPLLLSGGNITFGGDGDPKKGSRGNRSFIGTSGGTVYIGVVHGATVAEVAHVLKTLGVQNALNLDSGGSTAFWSGRYIVGPGRNTPFGILFVNK